MCDFQPLTFFLNRACCKYKETTFGLFNFNLHSLMVMNHDTHALGLSAKHCSTRWKKESGTSETHHA